MSQQPHSLTQEIAHIAARMIAQEGLDYRSAKQRAAQEVAGEVRNVHLPDNAQVETALREYQALFQVDTQPQRLQHLRKVAARLMERLLMFTPYLTGAVANGTAGEFSDIHIQLFTDNAKEVEIFLLNQNFKFEVNETPHFRKQSMIETISFLFEKEGVHLAIYGVDDIRGAFKPRVDGMFERIDSATLQKIMLSTS